MHSCGSPTAFPSDRQRERILIVRDPTVVYADQIAMNAAPLRQIASDNSSPIKKLIAVLLTLGVIAALDFFTSYELRLSVFYYVPVFLASWFIGRKMGLLIALTASVIWAVIDYVNAAYYSSDFYRWWNIGIRATSFIFVAWLVAYLRSAIDGANRLAAANAKALRALEDATAELHALKGTMQTVCAWTKKIRDNDEWITLEQYIERHLLIKLTHGMSPEGRKMFYDESPSLQRSSTRTSDEKVPTPKA